MLCNAQSLPRGIPCILLGVCVIDGMATCKQTLLGQTIFYIEIAKRTIEHIETFIAKSTANRVCAKQCAARVTSLLLIIKSALLQYSYQPYPWQTYPWTMSYIDLSHPCLTFCDFSICIFTVLYNAFGAGSFY